MDTNPQLLRRTHSPFVAAAAATAAPSTVAVETHDHPHPHPHPHQHQHQHQHSHGPSQPHLSPLVGAGLRPIGMNSPSLGLDSNISGGNSLLQIKKPLNEAHSTGISTSSSSSSMTSTTKMIATTNGNIPSISSADHSHSHGLFNQSQQHQLHSHEYDHSPRISQVNGFHGGAAEHKHEDPQHTHSSHQHQHHTHHHESQQFYQPQSFQQDHHDQGHNHGHSHDHGHDHGHGHGHVHSHGHHGHDHQGHDHQGHDHQGHDHHGHNHHGHNHHEHDHGHHHHHHHPVSFQSQLPSYGEIFTNLMPRQKTMFTWIMIHSTIAVMTWLSGMRAGSLSIIGLAYMMLFDAFGVFNIFLSSVVHTDTKLKRATVKHPFGVQRFEILFGLFNGIFLLFIGMNMLKESLEHLMLEDDHHGGNDHGPVVRVPLFWTVIALGATLVSSLGYQNHNQFCLLLNTSSLSSTQAAFARSNSSKLSSLARNQFTLTSLACVVGVILVAMFPRIDALDKVVAIGQSLVMFSLGGPLTKVLGMILLQTTPPKALEGVEEVVRQLSAANPAIVRLERAHVWTNTYGQLIGTAVVSVDKGADEQGILASIHQRLQGFLDLDAQSEGTGELTVQLVQSH
ncbi:cation efflux family-domain-containing protein [Gamsiella multidivaricata]|uniref:cation efflux family-domain-containing protein n=1 Tax=Gamsiella multidivaricata TaxID=101098 RepID=UPI0022209B6C|nr:cation efflux family-domain-containing protein [Gamsiella multidivaricata]KAI7821557.1 cation efflux family-domain-containing protein [Gamsiella multidivaricata]